MFAGCFARSARPGNCAPITTIIITTITIDAVRETNDRRRGTSAAQCCCRVSSSQRSPLRPKRLPPHGLRLRNKRLGDHAILAEGREPLLDIGKHGLDAIAEHLG